MDNVEEKVKEADAILTKFNPSPEQVDFLQAAIKLCTYKNKTKIAEDANVGRTRWYDWLKQDGFPEWFYSEFNRAIKFKVYELDAIGFKKAETDFKYFEFMQKKFGGVVIPDRPGIKIDVNATANAEAKTEISLGTEEAKRRLSRNLGILSRHGYMANQFSEN